MAGILAWFWNERFWLPHNVTWADLKNTDEATFPQAEDLYLAFPLALGIFMIRLVFERRFLGYRLTVTVKQSRRRCLKWTHGPNGSIGPCQVHCKAMCPGFEDPSKRTPESTAKCYFGESLYFYYQAPRREEVRRPLQAARLGCEDHPTLVPASAEPGEAQYADPLLREHVEIHILPLHIHLRSALPEEDLLAMEHQRMLVQLPLPATDHGHPLLLHSGAVLLPLLIVLPVHGHQEEVFSCTKPRTEESSFIPCSSPDFLIMFLHHLVTISLITFSYVNNMARVGALVMCLHDAADVLMEAAKMANYAKCQRLCNVIFVMFALVFTSSRLGVYPIWILNSTLFESWEIVGPFPSWWVFNVLLFLLLVLHSFWSYLIVRIACRAVSRGKVSKDDRSDIESSSDEEEGPPPTQKLHNSATNGTSGANGTNGYLSGPSCRDEH
ncbi:ceramide synthase 6 isoform X2 [Brienomyrus brachyistius]|uniref:ceramide synthase 6 isoform X2 n=1 Tax=Brienomyrus brachyistius TaxID=42636 RepID=UPI0020B3FAD3|nr:ceramide synthase 6 isoform X2 [Brienomyrus brachyistius]